MSDTKDVAKRVASILRALAARIEKSPEFVEKMGLSLGELPTRERARRTREVEISTDVFGLFAEGGEPALRAAVESLDIRALKRIVSQHGFDPSKLAEKWRKKERLVKLIVDRVAARYDKGKAFEKYP